ncbi:hypothetical protein KDJ56_11190 [Brevibacillus composti]|uniref:Uncharacterized protein n=1 Tax=Brevibacillus composti TaxID=2796470 RepID=A0ABX7ZAS1_9BACL|nr:phage tail protein [Brevibacillus composti]QUO43465.1 hypothetical protein KDJ56_11190 [Brevibacillus composti]
MRKFADDLFAWAHGIFKKRPRKEDMDIFKLTGVIGKMLDDAKLAIFRVRELKYILTSEGRALDLHGIDRKMPRLAGESDESYRKRLLAAYDLYREGGTEPGMKRVLESLGYPNAEIYPLYREKYKFHFHDGKLFMDGTHAMTAKEDGANVDYLSKWSQFIVYLNASDETLLQRDRDRLIHMINKAKPIESKLYAFMFSFAADAIYYLRHAGSASILSPAYLLNRPQGYLMNGRRVMDGSIDMRNAFAKSFATLSSYTRIDRQVYALHDGKHEMNGILVMSPSPHVIHSAEIAIGSTANVLMEPKYQQPATVFESSVHSPFHAPRMDGAVGMDGSQDRMREDGVAYQLRSTFSSTTKGGAAGSMGKVLFMDGRHLRFMDGQNRMVNDQLMDGDVRMDGSRSMRPIMTHLTHAEVMDGRHLLGGFWRMDGTARMQRHFMRHEKVALTVRRNGYVVERRAI